MVSHIHDSEPRPDPRVRALLAAAAAPTEPGPLPGETEAVAAFRTRSLPTRSFMPSSLTPLRVVVATGLGSGLLLVGGVGAAAAGALPGAAQDTARTWLDTVGVHVPGPDARSASHADERGRSAENGPVDEPVEVTAPDGEAAPRESGPAAPADSVPHAAPRSEKDLPTASEHGQTVSETARETELEGADKGELVSETAKSRRRGGDRAAKSSERRQDRTADHADRPAPAEGAGAAAMTGQATADEASGGRRDDAGDQRP